MSYKTCPICHEKVIDTLQECPNCSADLKAVQIEPQPTELTDINDNTVAYLTPTFSDENLLEHEEDFDLTLKVIKNSLDADDFTGVLSNYRSLEQNIPVLNNTTFVTVILDLLKQSAEILIKQKQKIVVLEQRRPTASRSCFTRLIGWLVLIPLLILAGIGAVSLFKIPVAVAQGVPIFDSFVASSPTSTITPEPRNTPVVEISPTPFPDTLPISANNVDSVRELYYWSVGENVTSLAFSPDGTMIATSDSTGTVKIWRIWTTEVLMEIPGLYASFSPDGRWIGTAGENGLVIYDALTGQKIRTLDEGSPFFSVLFSPDSQLIVGGTTYGNFYIWSVNDGEKQESSGRLGGDVRWLSFSRDGILLAAASNSKTYVWNLFEKKIGRAIIYEKNKPFFSGVALDEDGEWYAASTDEGNIIIWRVSNAETMAVLNDGGLQVRGLQYLNGSNAPEVLVSGNEVNLTFWGIQEYSYTNRTIYVSTPIQCLTVSTDNRLVATGGNDGVVHLWGVLP
ncbi:MAG: hypothetical protein HZB18_07755 [Chloroflexi bacterium]|nr:hypothetical protein [Chloroflexota bacterium]